MLEVREKKALTTEARKQDISSWQEVDITKLNSRAKRRFIKHRSALVAYFTTNKPVGEIVTRYHLSTGQLLKLAEDCVKQHADGAAWGYRALLPGVLVKDQTPKPAPENASDQDYQTHEAPAAQEVVEGKQATTDDHLEITAKHPAIKLPPSDAVEAISAAQAVSTTQSISSDSTQKHKEDQLAQVPVSISGTEGPIAEKSTPTDEIGMPSAENDPIEDETTPSAEDVSSAREEQETTASLDEPEQEFAKGEEARGDDEVILTTAAIDEQPQSLQSTEVALVPYSDVAVLDEPQHTSKDPYLLPKYAMRTKRSTTAKIAQRRRIVRRRWMRDTHDRGQQKKFLRIVSIAIVAATLLGLLIPVGVGLAAYGVYNNVSNTAHSGINHLMTVKNLLPVSKSDPMAALNPTKLAQVQSELKAAETDFEQLQQLANRPDIHSLVQQFSPEYAGQLVMARHLLQVALDVSRMGQELSGIGVIAANIVHGSPLASSSRQPLISIQDVAAIKAAIVHALYYIDDIQQNMSQVQLKDLPISANQKAQLASVLTQLPAIRNLIVQNQDMVDIVTWLLGVGQPRNFLIQTMDNAELRPGGGFTGQYGVLSVDNGRMGSFTLRDVALLDYAGNGMELGRQAPPQYRSWMNFGNWGLRDSNLSGDYPTTARINMQVFQEEGGGPVDGDIAFTPTFIGHLIDITGPIHVAEYNETITASNLEARLHYYQQDYTAIAIEHQKANDNSHQARKAFTSLLGKMLLDRVHHLSTKQLLDVIKVAGKDLQSRDLEIYFTNPAAEQWLVNHGYSGGLDTFSKQDGFALVQANVSISKASKYVHTTEHDDVVLDAQGGATHNLKITLDYNQTGPVYGYDTYSDYMRVYVPRSSQLQSGDGFDTGHPLCTPLPPPVPNKHGKRPPTPVSSCNSMAPSDTLYCPSGNYSLGTRGGNLPKVADAIGKPTATTSDLPGRGMWGGMTVTPKNCTTTIMLSWYVPDAIKHHGKHLSYTLFVQKQGGYVPSVELSVDTSAIKGLKAFSFKGNLVADRAFTLST